MSDQPLRISDHALVRYMERAKGIGVETYRDEIRALAVTQADTPKPTNAEQYLTIVVDYSGVVVTVLGHGQRRKKSAFRKSVDLRPVGGDAMIGRVFHPRGAMQPGLPLEGGAGVIPEAPGRGELGAGDAMPPGPYAVGMRVCACCRKTLPISAFYRRSGGRRFERRSWCKKCESAATKKARKDHPERFAAYREKEKLRRQDPAVRRLLTEQQHARYSGTEGIKRRLLHYARQRARALGLPYEIKAKDLNWPLRCPVLGIPLDYDTPSGRRAVSHGSPSLDRFDNARGYVPGNVFVISLRANILKRDGSYDELQRVAGYACDLLLPAGPFWALTKKLPDGSEQYFVCAGNGEEIAKFVPSLPITISIADALNQGFPA